MRREMLKKLHFRCTVLCLGCLGPVLVLLIVLPLGAMAQTETPPFWPRVT